MRLRHLTPGVGGARPRVLDRALYVIEVERRRITERGPSVANPV